MILLPLHKNKSTTSPPSGIPPPVEREASESSSILPHPADTPKCLVTSTPPPSPCRLLYAVLNSCPCSLFVSG